MVLHGSNDNLTNLAACDRGWDFHPLAQPSPFLPAWALDGHLLTGFEFEQHHAVHNIIGASPEQACELFYFLYPQLSWPELARLIMAPRASELLPLDLLFQKYGLHWDEHWQRSAQMLCQWPLEIQNFLSEKGIKPFDLTILQSLPLDDQLTLLSSLTSLKLSKSSFCQMLELAGELLLMGRGSDQILGILSRPEALQELKAERYPRTSRQDELFKKNINTWKLPGSLQLQAQRKGDILGLELRTFLKDPSEIEKLIKNLEQVKKIWSQGESDRSV